MLTSLKLENELIGCNSAQELEEISKTVTSLEKNQLQELFERFTLTELITFLEANHRNYLEVIFPQIEQSMAHIFGSNTEASSLLKKLVLFFDNYKEELKAHIEMEEKVFFPVVRQLCEGVNGSVTNQWTAFMEFLGNHDDIEEELIKVNDIIREASKNQFLPFSYSIFLNQLELFEMSLRNHAIIEDEVVMPRVLEMIKK